MHTCVRTVSGALLLGPRPIKLEQYTQCQNSKGWAKYVSFIATLWQYHVVKIGITKPVNFAWVRWADTVVYFHMNFLPLCVCVVGGLFFFLSLSPFFFSFFLFFFLFICGSVFFFFLGGWGGGGGLSLSVSGIPSDPPRSHSIICCSCQHRSFVTRSIAHCKLQCSQPNVHSGISVSFGMTSSYFLFQPNLYVYPKWRQHLVH